MKALIVGGTGGLGAQIAQVLSESHAEVHVIGRKKRASSAGRHLPCDLASEAATRELLLHLEKEEFMTPFTHFFWVAGFLKRSGFAQLEANDLLRMVDVNLRNPLLIAQWMWQRMNARRGAQSFAVISSTAGLSDAPREDEAVYAATKAAQVSFTRALGKQQPPSSVRVALFCPGGMQTELWADNENPQYASFMDPSRVARHIVMKLSEQTEAYCEVVIPRGSL